MKIPLLVLVSFSAAYLTAAPSLVLETDKEVYRAGELGLVTLRIEDAQLDPVPEKHQGPVTLGDALVFPSSAYDAGFVYRFRWKASKVGEQTIGPFTLKIGRTTMKSGKKIVRVVSDESTDVEASFDRIGVSVGADFNLEIRTKGTDLEGIRLMRSDLVRVGSMSVTVSRQISGGKVSASYIYKFPLKAVKAGVLEIGPENFDGLDAAVKFPRVKIEIVKK